MTWDQRWALLTGATSDIGRALARECARDGFDLVLVADFEPQLDRLRVEMQDAFPQIVVHTIHADLTAPHAPQRLYGEVKRRGIIVDALINDAGIGERSGFINVPVEVHQYVLHLNMQALMILTRLFVTDMRARNSGRILNIGSVAGPEPSPLADVYHASRAFVVSFSEALADELAATNVTVTCLCARAMSLVASGAGKATEARTTSPASVAAAGFKGLMAGERVVVPGAANWMHTFMRRFRPLSRDARPVRRGYDPQRLR